MRNYPKLIANLVAAGLPEPDAYRAIHAIELEDIVIEILHAEERRDRAAVAAANQQFWVWLARTQDRLRINQLDALHALAGPMQTERAQRQQLHEKNWRDKSVFLATILKYFCNCEDWQIVLITGVVGLPSVAEPDDKLSGLGL